MGHTEPALFNWVGFERPYVFDSIMTGGHQMHRQKMMEVAEKYRDS